jgi:hypothetical protein
MVGDGSTVLFWLDIWKNHLLHIKYPRLFSFAKNKNISVAQFFQNNQIENQFHLPLSTKAFQEYQELQSCLQQIQVTDQSRDSWHYIWGSSTYTSSTLYHLPYKNVNPPRPSSGSGTPNVPTR